MESIFSNLLGKRNVVQIFWRLKSLWTNDSPLFFCEILKIERLLLLMAAILISNVLSLTWGRVSNLLRGWGTVREEVRKIDFFLALHP